MNSVNKFSSMQLQSFAKNHIDYEFKMLLSTADLLRLVKTTIYKDPVHLSQFESFLIHARLLDDFFFPQERREKKWRPKSSGDVFAANYLPVGRSVSTVILSHEVRTAINKQAAHLCIERESKIRFPIQKMAISTCNAFNEFHGLLDGEKRLWFIDVKQKVDGFLMRR